MADNAQKTNGELLIRIDERTKRMDTKMDDICLEMREERRKDREQIKSNTENIIRHGERLGVINKIGALIGGTSLAAIVSSLWGKVF